VKNVRLLIADDNPRNLQFLSNSLSDDFCIVATVSDGKALIAAAVALDPQIVITDMPTRASLAAVRQLEALMPDIKIIVLTVQEEPEFATATIRAGASAVLNKEAPDLCGKIKAIVRDLLATDSEEFTGEAITCGNNRAWRGKGVTSPVFFTPPGSSEEDMPPS
jgi:DNA-binding NarL/FixJ family response regulator